MKKLLILSTLLLSSASAFARLCEVEMVDNRTNRVVQVFRDRDDDCAEAMRECKTELRLRGYTRGLGDCYLRARPAPGPGPRPQPNPYPNPQPNPYPNPQPNPYPNPYPQPGNYEARRPVSPGETVIMNSKRYTVMGTSYSGLLALRDSYGFTLNNIRREQVAVTAGCNIGVCVNQPVIQINMSKQMKVVGLGFDDSYVTEDNYGFMVGNVRYEQIARMSGCLSIDYRGQICVGNQVINRHNQYKTVMAIQPDGRVVLNDSYGFIQTNVEPRDLVITR